MKLFQEIHFTVLLLYFISIFADKISAATTTADPRIPNDALTTPATTKKSIDWSAMCKRDCSSSNILRGICNIPHPTDCQAYIVCFQSANEWNGMLSYCGHGTYFSLLTRNCDHSYKIKCENDRCFQKGLTMYKHESDNICATYWECDPKTSRSKATCCPEGQAYVEAFGCIEDKNCTNMCPATKNVTKEEENDDDYDCSVHEETVCRVNVHLDFEVSAIKNESPKAKCVFIKNSINDGKDAVAVHNGVGVFEGNSYLYVPYYNHNEFQVKEVFIQLKFKPAKTGEPIQVLVSTCSSNYEKGPSPSIEIKMDQTKHMLIFSGVTKYGRLLFDLKYEEDQWNKVKFVYNGFNTFSAEVIPEIDADKKQMKVVKYQGVEEPNPLLKPTMDLRIGSCFRGEWNGDKEDYFQGQMDDVYISSCVPEQTA